MQVKKYLSIFCFLLLCFNFETITYAKNSDNLLQYITDDFKLEHYTNRHEVKEQIQFFQKNRNFLDQITKKASIYMYYISQEVERRGLPAELVLLPVIESAYDPFAHSWVGAAGLWQFMPQTATSVGVKQNWWYDGRRDIVTSTSAALTHLKDLNKIFKGNWYLAIAAYNAGTGSVQRAVRYNKARNLSTNFFSLKLPYETKAYVPRLLALAEIIKNPAKYHVKLPKIATQPTFAEVDVGFQINLANAAKLADISLNELYQLNPGYNRWSTDPDGPHKLLLPLNKLSTFENNLFKEMGKHSKMLRYTVKENETLTHIARKYNASPHAIKVANKLPHNNISTSQILLIPKNTEYVTKNTHYAKIQRRLDNLNRSNYHIVEQGDSLWKIAKKNRINVDDLLVWNNLSASSTLRVGKKLQIRNPAANFHIVQTGDSLLKIAKDYKVPIKQLLLANNEIKTYIYPGQKIYLPSSVKKSTTSTKPKLTSTQPYKVKPGDSLHRLAQQYQIEINILKQANQLDSEKIKVGQILHIPQYFKLDKA